MRRLKRRRLLQLAAGGFVGASWWRADRARGDTADGPEEGPSEGPLREAAESDEFDPTVHGFGFANWEGASGTGADGEEFTYEPEDVTREDVRRAIDDSWTAVLSEAKRHLMTRIVHSWIGGNAATNGHCYGMVVAADDYFQSPSELPAGVGSASEIPHPTGEYDAVGDRIRRLQTTQLLRAEPFWYAFLGFRWGLADHRESIEQLTEAIDATGTGGLALDGEDNPHQVMAHGYEHADGVTDAFIYDPGYEAADHANGVWTLSVDRETGDVLEIEDGYDEFLYHDPGLELPSVDGLVGGHDRVLDELSNAVFLGLEAGGSLTIDVPGDVLVDRPAAEYADPESAPYADAAVVFGSPDEFEVSIDGENGEEYSLDTFGLRDGDLVVEEVVSGTLEEVPARLRLALDEAGEFVVDVVEEAEEAAEGAATDGVEQAAEEAEETVEDANDDGWIEDNWWIAAVGGALGLGVAYRYLARRSGDEDGT